MLTLNYSIQFMNHRTNIVLFLFASSKETWLLTQTLLQGFMDVSVSQAIDDGVETWVLGWYKVEKILCARVGKSWLRAWGMWQSVSHRTPWSWWGERSRWRRSFASLCQMEFLGQQQEWRSRRLWWEEMGSESLQKRWHRQWSRSVKCPCRRDGPEMWSHKRSDQFHWVHRRLV